MPYDDLPSGEKRMKGLGLLLCLGLIAYGSYYLHEKGIKSSNRHSPNWGEIIERIYQDNIWVIGGFVIGVPLLLWLLKKRDEKSGSSNSYSVMEHLYEHNRRRRKFRWYLLIIVLIMMGVMHIMGVQIFPI